MPGASRIAAWLGRCVGSGVGSRRVGRAGSALLALILAAPVAATALLSWPAAAPGESWIALQSTLQDAQFLPAWALALWVGGASTVAAWWLSARLARHLWLKQSLNAAAKHLPPALAMPHLALAVGLVLWLAPTGWLSRLGFAVGLLGQTPPQTELVQDPWGLALIAGLVIKEVPFLLWLTVALMRREDLRRRFMTAERLALALGWSGREAFDRLIWPTLAQRLRWPALAVLVYGCSVVDMALVLGPSRPPTLAVWVWQGLNDADPERIAQGQWGGVLLGASSLLLGWLLWTVHDRWIKPSPWQRPHDREASAASSGGLRWLQPSNTLTLIYTSVSVALLTASFTGQWTYPAWWPQTWTLSGWAQVLSSSQTLGHTLAFAAVSASVGLLASLVLLAFIPRPWKSITRRAWMLTLWWPTVLWVTGAYQAALWLNLEGTVWAVVAGHVLIVLPYVLLSLQPAWEALPSQLDGLCASLGQSPWRAFWHVKLPLLRPALASAWAAGFAVSVAQYLPTAFLGAGRWETVTTEALTLSSGGQRATLAAYAMLQFLLPVLALGLAAVIGRPRAFAAPAAERRPA
jgi:putative thiamine transport system permease protein